MTDAQNPAAPATPAVAAGWYPDPSSAGQQRWWDGTTWTEQVSAPAVAASTSAAYATGDQLKAPAGTSGNTPWIWFVVFLPLLPIIPMVLIDFAGLIDNSIRNPLAVTENMLDFVVQPAVILSIVLSWLANVGTIVFAYLDWRALKRRGVPQPFHWAFSFLVLVSLGVVYPIGRAVVAKRRTGSGNGVLLATILTIVISVIFGIVYALLVINYAVAVATAYSLG